MSAALQMRGVERREASRPESLVSGIDWSVAAGTLCALVGADGAGKTTLMRIAAGILKPQQGQVLVFDEPLYAAGSTAQRRIGYMPQKFGLYEDLSVMENFLLYADIFGLTEEDRRERFEELLSMTDLTRFTARPAGKLSGGMKQKLGLACALLNRPDILLLDEPSVGVDPLSRRELWSILRQSVAASRMTAVVATTYMDEAALCDTVTVIEEGRLRFSETPVSLANKAAGRTLSVRKPGVRVRDLQADLMDDRETVLDAVPAAGGVDVLLREGVNLSTFASQHGDLRICERRPRLEDGYLAARAGIMQERGGAGELKDEHAAGSVSDPVIRAQNVKKKFGDFVAVDSTSFVVRPGEIFGLLGPNGAGKTTTFRMLCGLTEVTDGSLFVAGSDVRRERNTARGRLGYMSQKFALYGSLSARENLEFFAGAYGLPKPRATGRIEKMLRAFDLKTVEDKPADALSGGIRQRLAMAAALLHQPAVLFLDEPTSGADIPTRRQFWRWMTELSRNGTTIIVTTHFMEEAQYCDRMIIQDAGRVLVMGTPEEIRRDSATMDEAFIRVVQQSRHREAA